MGRNSLTESSGELPTDDGRNRIKSKGPNWGEHSIENAGERAVEFPGIKISRYAKSCVSEFASLVFNRFLMYIRSCHIRLFFVRLRVAVLGTRGCLLMGVELRNGRNLFAEDRVVINKRYCWMAEVGGW